MSALKPEASVPAAAAALLPEQQGVAVMGNQPEEIAGPSSAAVKAPQPADTTPAEAAAVDPKPLRIRFRRLEPPVRVAPATEHERQETVKGKEPAEIEIAGPSFESREVSSEETASNTAACEADNLPAEAVLHRHQPGVG